MMTRSAVMIRSVDSQLSALVSRCRNLGRRVDPTDSDIAFGEELFRRYKAKEGSEHIAKAKALAYLSACLRLYRPRTVVEIGAGIGTVTDALLSHECAIERVVSFEHNAFCLSALATNLRHHDPSRFAVVPGAQDLMSMQIVADMIVGDGSMGRQHGFCARSGTVVFIEGTREGLREELDRHLAGQSLSLWLAAYGQTYWRLQWKRIKWRVPKKLLKGRVPRRVAHRLPSKIVWNVPSKLVWWRRQACWIGQVEQRYGQGGV